MARVKGLEPLTVCLEGRCSIQLSYTPIFLTLYRRGAELSQRAVRPEMLPADAGPAIRR